MPKGIKGFQRGYKQTEEHKKKIGDAHRGKKKNYPAWNKGKSWDEEHKIMARKAHLGMHHTIETRRRISEKMRGDKTHFWKGGITPINMMIRSSLEYKLWRESVFKRDNWTCIWCGQKGSRKTPIQADHIKPFACYPELRFAIDNGRTLCVPCHKTTNTYLSNRFKDSSK